VTVRFRCSFPLSESFSILIGFFVTLHILILCWSKEFGTRFIGVLPLAPRSPEFVLTIISLLCCICPDDHLPYYAVFALTIICFIMLYLSWRSSHYYAVFVLTIISLLCCICPDDYLPYYAVFVLTIISLLCCICPDDHLPYCNFLAPSILILRRNS
jgi:hypothetical protein